MSTSTKPKSDEKRPNRHEKCGCVTAFDRQWCFAVSRGANGCDKKFHWMCVPQKNEDGSNGHYVLTNKHYREILGMMLPYKEYTCKCELDALRAAASHNYQGMPQTDYVSFGAVSKGVGKFDPHYPAKRVLQISYRLNQEQTTYLLETYPDWVFVTTKSDGHDHPVAHTQNMLATYSMADKLTRGTPDQPYRVLDYYGNPTANESFNKREPSVKIDTSVFCCSPKDAIRQRTKWGKQFDADGKRRYYDLELRSLEGDGSEMNPVTQNQDFPGLASYDEIISIHTLYYNTPNEICRIVNKADAVMTAIIHRFPEGKTGSLNNGEQSFRRFEEGEHRWIEQTNVDTNEKYKHFDNAWIFESDTMTWCHTLDGSKTRDFEERRAMTWTVNKMNADTYRVQFCPLNIVTYNLVNAGKTENDTSGHYRKVQPVLTKKAKSSKKQIKASGVATVEVSGKTKEISVQSDGEQALFEAARIQASQKPRTTARYADHVSWVKRQINGPTADKKYKGVDSSSIAEITFASFWVDAESELHAKRELDTWMLGWKTDKEFRQGTSGMSHTFLDKSLDIIDVALSAKSAASGVRGGLNVFRSFVR